MRGGGLSIETDARLPCQRGNTHALCALQANVAGGFFQLTLNTPGQNGQAVVQFNGITTVGITTGTGNDVVTVTSAPLDVQLSISTGGGSDTVNLGQSGGNELPSFQRHCMRPL
jgi:hypothetical protein